MRLAVCRLSKKYIPMQTLQPHIPYDLNTQLGKEKLFIMARSVATNLWSGTWRAPLNIHDGSSLIGVDSEGSGILMKKSAIQRKHSERCLCCASDGGCRGDRVLRRVICLL